MKRNKCRIIQEIVMQNPCVGECGFLNFLSSFSFYIFILLWLHFHGEEAVLCVFCIDCWRRSSFLYRKSSWGELAVQIDDKRQDYIHWNSWALFRPFPVDADAAVLGGGQRWFNTSFKCQLLLYCINVLFLAEWLSWKQKSILHLLWPRFRTCKNLGFFFKEEEFFSPHFE